MLPYVNTDEFDEKYKEFEEIQKQFQNKVFRAKESLDEIREVDDEKEEHKNIVLTVE